MAGWEIQGRDALTGGTAGASIGGSLGIYIQGITTGGTSSAAGNVSPDNYAPTSGPSGTGGVDGTASGTSGAPTGSSGLVSGSSSTSASTLMLLATLAMLGLMLFRKGA